jgi:hypothetical protein
MLEVAGAMTRFTACFEVSANWGAGAIFLAYVTFI